MQRLNVMIVRFIFSQVLFQLAISTRATVKRLLTHVHTTMSGFLQKL